MENLVVKRSFKSMMIRGALIITFITPLLSNNGEHSPHVHDEHYKKREFVYRKLIK